LGSKGGQGRSLGTKIKNSFITW